MFPFVPLPSLSPSSLAVFSVSFLFFPLPSPPLACPKIESTLSTDLCQSPDDNLSVPLQCCDVEEVDFIVCFLWCRWIDAYVCDLVWRTLLLLQSFQGRTEREWRVEGVGDFPPLSFETLWRVCSVSGRCWPCFVCEGLLGFLSLCSERNSHRELRLFLGAASKQASKSKSSWWPTLEF